MPEKNNLSGEEAQLATIAGTLVYGSPSWRRASQVAPYLTQDDSEE